MSELTREMILEMPAGREMDALIAEKVMGWKWVKLPDFSREKQLGIRWNHIRALCPPCGNPSADFKEKIVDLGHILAFSTNIAAAWQVVERIYGLGLAKQFLPGLYAQGVVNLDKIAHHTPDIDCRAALLATLE